MKKSKNKKITLEDMFNDVELLMGYVDELKKDVNIENIKDIKQKANKYNKKYKDFLPKDDLDTKK